MEIHRIQRKKVEVPIIPLIDILIILLFFFIVTMTFKKKEPVMEIEMPVVSGDSTSQSTNTRSVLTMTLEGDVTLDFVRIVPGTLQQHLQAFRDVNPDRELELRIDEGVALGKTIELYDALQTAGFETPLLRVEEK